MTGVDLPLVLAAAWLLLAPLADYLPIGRTRRNGAPGCAP